MADAAACSTEFVSARVESLREALSMVDVNDDEARVEAEIEASKVHWSELTSAYVTAVETQLVESSSSTSEWEGSSEVEMMEEWNGKVAKDNVEVFRSLQARYPGGFFVDDNDEGPVHLQELPRWMIQKDGTRYDVKVKLSNEKPFAEGAQAQLFHAHTVFPWYEGERGKWVMKVFKEGTSLRDLQRLLPPSLLNDKHTQGEGCFNITGCIEIRGARLMKADGRFAFLMMRAWGDLRKLIDVRKLDDNNQGAPFPNNIATWCMYGVAIGMQGLHAKGIVHRDLKAANVLIGGRDRFPKVDPSFLNPRKFGCFVADYECSVGVVGTRFWRAPEILLAVKNRSVYQNPEIFSKEADVYSFGMTCYEILTGGIPFEELHANDYDGVIGGARPILPTHTTPQIIDMVKRCWHKDLALRPTFDQILEILQPLVDEVWEAYGP